jgi:leucyl aminopeptidase (aminopeptidase T)
MLKERAGQLNERRFDAVRFRGPGTDLTVGLLPIADWTRQARDLVGQFYVPNLPTEEVFTTPDYRRTEGRCGRPSLRPGRRHRRPRPGDDLRERPRHRGQA